MIVVLMGVTGSGKTTVGKVLANDLHWKFYDADDYHPAANIEKMRRGRRGSQALAPDPCQTDRRCTGSWREHRSCLFSPQTCLPGVPAASSGCRSLRLPLRVRGGDREEAGCSEGSFHEPRFAGQPVRDTRAA